MAKKNKKAVVRGSGSTRGLPFLLQLPIFVLIAIVMAVFWLFEKLLNLGRGAEEEEPPFDESRHVPELRALAEVLARGDPAALEIVRLAIDDRNSFIDRYQGTKRPRGGPALGALIADLGEDLDAYAVLEEVYENRGLIATIDWRSEIELSQRPIDRMLKRLGVDDFDWSFVDMLLEHGDGTELRNNNFLTLVGDRLRPRGFTLAHLDQFGDSYGFAVVSLEDFESIRHIDNRRFAVRADFGPDEAYESAQKIVAAHDRAA
jgi:hypothetical protein